MLIPYVYYTKFFARGQYFQDNFPIFSQSFFRKNTVNSLKNVNFFSAIADYTTVILVILSNEWVKL